MLYIRPFPSAEPPGAPGGPSDRGRRVRVGGQPPIGGRRAARPQPSSVAVAGPVGVAPPSSDQSCPWVSSLAGSETTSGVASSRPGPAAVTGVVSAGVFMTWLCPKSEPLNLARTPSCGGRTERHRRTRRTIDDQWFVVQVGHVGSGRLPVPGKRCGKRRGHLGPDESGGALHRGVIDRLGRQSLNLLVALTAGLRAEHVSGSKSEKETKHDVCPPKLAPDRRPLAG